MWSRVVRVATAVFVVAVACILGSLASLCIVVFWAKGLTPEVSYIVPGQSEAEFHTAGDYDIFYERAGVVDGVVYQAPDPLSPLAFSVTAADGTSLRVSSFRNSVFSGSDNITMAGTGIASFSVGKPGRYLIRTAYVTGTNEPRVVMTIYRDYERRFWTMFIVGMVVPWLFIGVAVLLVVMRVRRKRERRDG